MLNKAKNTETGEQDWKPVTKVFIEPDRGIFEVKLMAKDGFEQKIQATDDHGSMKVISLLDEVLTLPITLL